MADLLKNHHQGIAKSVLLKNADTAPIIYSEIYFEPSDRTILSEEGSATDITTLSRTSSPEASENYLVEAIVD